MRRTFDFLTRLLEIDLTIYIYNGDFGRTPAYELEKLAEGRSVSERSDGLDGLIPAWRLNYCASRRGGWITDSWAVFRFIRSAG